MGLFGKKDSREGLKGQVDKLMKDYDKEKIDGATYARKMMELTSSFKRKKKK